MKTLPLGPCCSATEAPEYRAAAMILLLHTSDPAYAVFLWHRITDVWDEWPAILTRALNFRVPAYAYFGERDGVLGVWPALEALNDPGILHWEPREPWPKDHAKYDYVVEEGNGRIDFYNAATMKKEWRWQTG